MVQKLQMDAFEKEIAELSETDPQKAADLQIRVNEIKSRYISEMSMRKWLGRLSLGLFVIAILLAWNKDIAQALMCLVFAGALTAFSLLSARWIIYSFLVIPAMGLGMYVMSGRVKGGLFSFKKC